MTTPVRATAAGEGTPSAKVKDWIELTGPDGGYAEGLKFSDPKRADTVPVLATGTRVRFPDRCFTHGGFCPDPLPVNDDNPEAIIEVDERGHYRFRFRDENTPLGFIIARQAFVVVSVPE